MSVNAVINGQEAPVAAAEVGRLLDQLESVILGKREALTRLLIAVLAGGHVLMEDVPGVGKTTLARALAHAFDLDFKRVQFTPDLMPTDIVGSSILKPTEGRFEFAPGPVFTHILLGDEINRASPRTQSALLEAMSEGQVTLDGVTRPLPNPFLVIATQNPVEAEGTFPLPEAQLDRFVMRLSLGYPALDHELNMLFAQQHAHPLDQVEPVANAEGLARWQAAVRQVQVKEPVARYLLALVHGTRGHRDLALGASPRGALALFRCAQAKAFFEGRDFVTPEDIQSMAQPVLAHRMVIGAQARYAGRSTAQVVDEVIEGVAVPV